MPRRLFAVGLALSLGLAAACGSTSSPGPLPSGLDADLPETGTPDTATPVDASAPDAPAPVDAAPPFDAGLGAPITAPADTWTWVGFPDSKCDDGSTTGVGVNLAPGAKKSVIFLNGGGACADYQTCFVLNTATHGPFGAAELAGLAGGLRGSALDRTDPQNPFRDYNMVFVPYCTGDLHAGSNVATYTGSGQTRTFHHVGRSNMLAYLKRLAPTFAGGTDVVLAGSSAGGFGATLNHDLVRQYFPTVSLFVIDDSGPLFVGDAVPPILRSTWTASWRLDLAVGALCPSCANDFSAIYGALAAKYPNDRSALLSSYQDKTIRSYLLKDAAAYEAAVRQLTTTVLDGHPQYRYFLTPGEGHTMLGNPSAFTSGGVDLRTWLTQMVSRDPAWTSKQP